MEPISKSLWTDSIKAAVNAFANAATEPNELNAIYDALQNKRLIESVFPTGLYRYKTAENHKAGAVDYMPAPVATNPMIALAEAASGHVDIRLSFHNSKAWFATCALDNGKHVGEVLNDDRDQAIARALVIAICKKMLGDEAQHG